MYKIVGLRGRERWSLYARQPYAVQYAIDRWVTAPVGGLFAFQDLTSAERWFSANAEIWRAEAEIWRAEAEERVPLPPSAGFTNYVHCWTASPAYWRPICCVPWPDGTVAYRRIRLVERIENVYVQHRPQ
jgi:hypothetical protein